VRRTIAIIVVIGALTAAAASHRAIAAAPVSTPILVELFTSEGCSDCPAADALLERLVATQPVDGAEIIGLGQHVDYWDRLGWKDRFSSAALTNRQQAYQTRFKTESIYTPQMVVDGSAEFVGSDASAARRAIDRAQAKAHGVVRIDIDSDGGRPFVNFDGGRPFVNSDVGRPFVNSDVGRPFVNSDVGRPFQGRQEDRPDGDPKRVALHLTVSDLPPLGRGDRADIIVAITEDHLRTEVKRGENHGRTLTHAAVVRYLAVVGQAASDGTASARAEIPLGPDWRRDRLKIVGFVQAMRARTILASAFAPLQNTRR
jgi:hypothetical protein